jgi:hypothetical protein
MRPAVGGRVVRGEDARSARGQSAVGEVDVMAPGVRVSGLDVAVGVTAAVLGTARGATQRAGDALAPARSLVLRPPGVPPRLQAGHWVEALGREGQGRRDALLVVLARQLDVLVPLVLAEVLRRADLTGTVLRYVDLDAVVAAVDLDAAVKRVDLDAAVAGVDLDAAVARVDVDAVVERADLDAAVARVDLTAVVLERVDLAAVVDAVLGRVDLTAVVLERVDLDALIDAILARIDLISLAEDVIEGVDLPEIIRESTGSMASDTVQGARMQGIVADEAVGRVVDRFLLRRGGRSTQAPAAREARSTGRPAVPPPRGPLG